MENFIASEAKRRKRKLNNSDNSMAEEIFSQIDLALAQITKDQEKIQSLAKETDELLNQLKDMAS